MIPLRKRVESYFGPGTIVRFSCSVRLLLDLGIDHNAGNRCVLVKDKVEQLGLRRGAVHASIKRTDKEVPHFTHRGP